MHVKCFERTIMHIDVSHNTIRKLTEYISPKEIEKIRYERYNTHKINNGNLVCDKFFRMNEGFNRNSDSVNAGYRSYGTDDLPIYYNGEIERDITQYSTRIGNYTLETELPPHVTLLKNGHKIYTEKFQFLPDTNPLKIKINKAMDEGCSLEEAINILDSAQIDISHKNELFSEGIRLLKEKYPLATVLKYMEDAKLKDRKGNRTYIPGTIGFITKYPHLRELIIHKNIFKNEVVDVAGMNAFPKIIEKCNSEEDAIKIAKACQHKTLFKEDTVTNRNLVDLALHIYSRNKTWTQTDTALLNEIGNSTKKLEKAFRLFGYGQKTKDIIPIVRSN